MTGSFFPDDPEHTRAELPAPLAEYADRLLLGTGLEAADAVLIASRQLVPPPDLRVLGGALQAGWFAEEDPS